MNSDEFQLEDILIIIRRRILFFLIPVIVLTPIGLIAVMLLPPQYMAQGTILVESQQIPEEFVPSTINSYAQERIQVIRQRVMTRERLLSVAAKYKLYDDRPDMSGSEKVADMRAHLGVRLISVNPGNRYRQQDGTIAFEIFYSDRSPQKAYLVANEFMTLFLTEDVRTRKEGASDTTEFFDQEARRMRAAVDELETRISAFREANSDALPEHLDLRTRTLDRKTQELSDAEDQLALLDEERRALESQLSSYISGSNLGPTGPAQELAKLKSQLATLRAEKTEAHPDVAAIRTQIAALERQAGPSAKIVELRAALEEQDAKIAAALAAEDVDLVAELRTKAIRFRQELGQQLIKEASSGSGDFVVAQMQSRLEIIASRYESTIAEIAELQDEIETLQDQIARTPDVARGLGVLVRDQANLEKQYQLTQGKRQQAITAENLEDGQKAEKFSILEPAVPPETPSSPDRLKLSILAVFVAFGAGGACAGAAEIIGGTLRGKSHLATITDEQPIAVIPYIPAEGERRFLLTSFVPTSQGKRSPAAA
ncbi:MAG: hypothetical protein GC152_10770 [Alphaproteobacteria bacterium]|nr:hypothetical protein [Alphaproteobacteria bacterium]